MGACKTASNSAWIKPEPPRVSCQQPIDSRVPVTPQRDEWVEAVAVLGVPAGAARLSEKAVVFIADLAGLLTNERAQRAVEHDCLDASEKQGLIQQ